LSIVYIEAVKYELDLAKYRRVIYFSNEALRIIEAKDPIDIAIQSTMWNTLGRAWHAKGDYDQAIAYYEKSLAVFSTVLGKQHPHTLLMKKNLAATKQQQNSAFADL